MSQNSIRTVPQQSRSQQTVDLILDTAAALFVEVGFENSTTNAIAERAGISIGTLYRYYPDKDAVLKALAERYYRQEHLLLDRVLVEDMQYLPLPLVIDRVLDPLLALHGQYPAYAHILLGSDVSADIAAVACDMEQELLERMAAFYRLLAPHIGVERAHVIAVVSKSVVKALIALLVASKDNDYRVQITIEFKNLLLRYLQPILRP